MSYHKPLPDTRFSEAGFTERVEDVFEAKNSGEPGRFLSKFSPDQMSYSDATLGRATVDFSNFTQTIERLMPRWRGGRSFPLRIMGGPRSGVIALSDTPEMFGDEIRAMAAIELDSSGLVTRWCDYWDSRHFDNGELATLRASDPAQPAPSNQPTVACEASVQGNCRALHSCFTNSEPVETLIAFDAVWEDMVLRTRLEGAKAIISAMPKMSRKAPYGQAALVTNILGGEQGGGYEWSTATGDRTISGITAVEIDDHGLVTRITTTYDGSLITPVLLQEMIIAMTE